MKKYLQILSLMAILGGAILVFSQCKKDEDDNNKDPEPKDKTSKFYNKWWYPVDAYGDFYFNDDKTFQYQFFATTVNGTYSWYSGNDSMRIYEETGGEWTAWFREITDNEFRMSRGNEDHMNIYIYRDTKE